MLQQTSPETVSRAFHRAKRPSPILNSFLAHANTMAPSEDEARALIQCIIVAISRKRPDDHRSAIRRIETAVQPGPSLHRLMHNVADFAASLPPCYYRIASDIVPPLHLLIAPLTDRRDPPPPAAPVRTYVIHDLTLCHQDIVRAVAGYAAQYSIARDKHRLQAETSALISTQAEAIQAISTAARDATVWRWPTPSPRDAVRIAARNQTRLIDRSPKTSPESRALTPALHIAATSLDHRYRQVISQPPPADTQNILATIACWDGIYRDMQP